MFIINVSEPFAIILLLAITVLLIFLGKEIRKPVAPGIALVVHLGLAVMHAIQMGFAETSEIYHTIVNCITIDAVMILISFFAYLWVDDIACKFYKKKSIDNSLDWFWNKV